MSSLEEIAKEDLIKLARKLQRHNKQLQSRIEELEKQLTAAEEESAAARATPAPPVAPPTAPPPGPTLTASTSHDDSKRMQRMEKLLEVTQEGSRNKDTEILRLREQLESLSKSLELISREKTQRMTRSEAESDQVLGPKTSEDDSKRIQSLDSRVRELESLLEMVEQNSSLKDQHIQRLTSDLAHARDELVNAATAAPAVPVAAPEPPSGGGGGQRRGSLVKAEQAARSYAEQLRLQLSEEQRVTSDLRVVLQESARQVDVATSARDQAHKELEDALAEFRTKVREQNAKIGNLHRRLSTAQVKIRTLQGELRTAHGQITRQALALRSFETGGAATTPAENAATSTPPVQPTATEVEEKKDGTAEEPMTPSTAEKRLAELISERDRIIEECEARLLRHDQEHSARYRSIVQDLRQEHDDSELGGGGGRRGSMGSIGSLTGEEEEDYQSVLGDVGQYMAEIRLLKEEIDELERSRSRTAENLDYLKNVVVKFLMMERKKDERRVLIPVLAMILHFTPEELRSIEGQWR